MKPKFDLVVVMPVGPNANPAFIEDTLNSFKYYTSCSYKIIIADDSQKGTGLKIKELFPDDDFVVLTRSKNLGRMAGLYLNLALAYKHAIDNYRFDALLKIDDDALITGENPETEALSLLRSNPNVGMIGRHLAGRYSTDDLGHRHDNYWPRQQLLKATCTWRLIRRPIANMTLRKLFIKALWNGYEIGENIQGGAYFISEQCLIKMNEQNLLPEYRLKTVILEEDHLFSLLTKVVGLELADLADERLPFGIAFKGLPGPPEKLHEQGKKIIHSIRFWKDMKEDAIRTYFRGFRHETKSLTPAK